MKYKNPIIKGMYPDPSICYANGQYYMVHSTFEYYPGVPIFISDDLINWVQIGHCLTRESQFDLENSPCSGGIFAPTIRYHEGLFYMITTCFSKGEIKNFIVTAETPEGEWSDPIFIDFEGIDPSLYWEEGRTYVQYAFFGKIMMVEIDIKRGEIIEGPIIITNGCGGRDAEGPHIWKKDGYYYLLLAEGGTREGHMVTMMRSENIWGPYEPSPYNPILSNKDLPKELIQCVGHADWITDKKGNDYLVALGVRQVKHKTLLGRETMITPAYWTEDGWLRSKFGYMPLECEVDIDSEIKDENTEFKLDMNTSKMPFEMLMIRGNKTNYEFSNGQLELFADGSYLDDIKPSFWGIRQNEFEFNLASSISFAPENESHEAGLAVVATKDCHMSIFATKRNGKHSVVMRKKTQDIVTEKVYDIGDVNKVRFSVKGNKEKYAFYYELGDGQENLADWTYTKHLSVECACTPNTGVVMGMFIAGEHQKAIVHDFIYTTNYHNS